MDFFRAQDAARGSTFLLVVLFALAVISLVVVTNLLLMLFLGLVDANQITTPAGAFSHYDWGHFLAIGAAVALVIAAGSIYKLKQLAKGGSAVAEALGGRIIAQDTLEPAHRRVLNVVEEMAIASGTTVPPVYLLEQESGINAFAAGLTPANAVIGLTKGAVEGLSREQLQGVIAHEFSHILNGDMRLNIRLAGVLHGILLIGLIGYHLLHSGGRGGSDSRGSSGFFVLGLGLMAVGYGGTFFSNLIKASVGRQREFLADATAVQFTRNPAGIAGALKRIGSANSGALLTHPDAPEMSHAYFAQGIRARLGRLSATHPRLEERIRRIQPGWNGRFAPAPTQVSATGWTTSDGATSSAKLSALTDSAGSIPNTDAARIAEQAVEQIGHPDETHLRYAQSLIGTLSPALHWAAREPYGARALVYALVLDRNTEVRRHQLVYLEEQADLGVYDYTLQLVTALRDTRREHHLPLLDLCMPALRQLSLIQYRTFNANLDALIRMDARINLFEWCLSRILLSGLAPDFGERRSHATIHKTCADLPRECALIFTLLTQVSANAPAGSRASFEAARAAVGIADLEPTRRNAIHHQALDAALKRLSRLKPRAKRTFLDACAAGVSADQQVSPAEFEVLRAVSAVIDCPMPPILLSGM